MKKCIVCKKCGFENLPGTQFCQRCGSKILLKFTDKIASSLAGTGQRGSSLAPLGAMAIEAQAEELGKTAAPPKLVPVIPLENGDWYCPDCGEYNPKYSLFCKNCGWSFIHFLFNGDGCGNTIVFLPFHTLSLKISSSYLLLFINTYCYMIKTKHTPKFLSFLFL